MPRSPWISRKKHVHMLKELSRVHEESVSAIRRAYDAERRAMAVSTALMTAIKEES